MGSNPKVNRIVRHVERAADVECTVLVSGETGTGKELWARLLHRLGPRRDKPFVPVNCAALTATLAESQLFGHEKGAFTGAAGRSLGVFRAAEGGIVFLDEVGEMPLELQPKLLRVLQQHEVTPVGSSMPVHVDVQVVAATNRDLELEVAEGRFREDLYYRLNMVEFHVPPLRHRVDDIPQFRGVLLAQVRRPLPAAAVEAEQRDAAAILRVSLAGQHPPVGQHHRAGVRARLRAAAARTAATRGGSPKRRLPFMDLGQLRRIAVRQALRATQGHKGRAARLLGVHPNTMTRLLAQIRGEEPDADLSNGNPS